MARFASRPSTSSLLADGPLQPYGDVAPSKRKAREPGRDHPLVELRSEPLQSRAGSGLPYGFAIEQFDQYRGRSNRVIEGPEATLDAFAVELGHRCEPPGDHRQAHAPWPR